MKIETGYICSGAPSSCKTDCGDGKRVGGEVCDDFNTNAGDGCINDCSYVETGYTCSGGSLTSRDIC